MAIHLGDVGTVFLLTLTRDGATFDVSTASVKQIRFKDSADVLKVKTAAFTTNGSDGKIQYTTIAGDLEKAGALRIQAVVTLASGSWSSDIISVPVIDNLL